MELFNTFQYIKFDMNMMIFDGRYIYQKATYYVKISGI